MIYVDTHVFLIQIAIAERDGLEQNNEIYVLKYSLLEFVLFS